MSKISEQLSSPSTADNKEVSIDAVHHIIENGTATILDVRRPEEFAAGHMPGALSVPMADVLEGGAFDLARVSDADFAAKYGHARPDKSHPLVLHCFSGLRAGKVMAELERLGYTHAKRFHDGWRAWMWSKLPPKLLADAPPDHHHDDDAAVVDFDMMKSLTQCPVALKEKLICGFTPLLLLDVRSREEFASDGVISDGALNIPLGELQQALELDEDAFQAKYGGVWKPNPMQPIVCHCWAGGRAKKAVALLRAAGYKRAFYYPGSVREWQWNHLPEELRAFSSPKTRRGADADGAAAAAADAKPSPADNVVGLSVVQQAAGRRGFLGIDVRAREEVAASGVTVPGSVNVPIDELVGGAVFDESKLDDDAFHARFGFYRPPKDQPIVVFCAGGECRAAHTAFGHLIANGYNRVKVFDFAEWPKNAAN